MLCIACHKTIEPLLGNFVVCPNCGSVNNTSTASMNLEKPAHDEITSTVTKSFQKRSTTNILQKKLWILVSLALLFIAISVSGVFLFSQHTKATSLLSTAKKDMKQEKYVEATALLTKASKLFSLGSTKKSIIQAKSQNLIWQTSAKKLEQSNQLIAQGKLDEASILLSQIDKSSPAYEKVQDSQKAIQAQKEAINKKIAVEQPAAISQSPQTSKSLSPQTSKPNANPIPTFSTTIQIKGDAACQSTTLDALKLISDKASAHYAIVVKYISIIECTSQGSGMFAYETPPRYLVGDASRNAGSVWYAGTIVHDAGHSKLYHDYQINHQGESIPNDVWTGESAERTCLEAQRNALTLIGGTQSQIDYVQNVINSQYYNIPYDQRWW